jgi:uncharacterized surface protein with fasciclin (FAS1) repeats
MLDGNGEYTVFAPTNAAFATSGYTSLVFEAMTDADVENLVKNHIVSSKLDVKTITTTQELSSNGSLKLILQKIGESWYVDGADLTNPSQPTTNGYVNVINKVLASKATLADAVTNYQHTTVNSQLTFLVAAITKASTGSTDVAGLLSGSDAFTFFAPNNAAFINAGFANLAAVQNADASVLGNLLRYQLIAGRKLTTAFDSVAVTALSGTPVYFDRAKESRTTFWYANGVTFGNGSPSNILAANGVMHVVSRFFPAPVAATTLAYIQSEPDLSLFYALIQRASAADPNFNFATMLSDPKSSYTVFALNNAGLQAYGYANETAIAAEAPDVLARLLKFHMIRRRFNNSNVGDNTPVNTLYKVKDPTTADERIYQIVFSTTGGFQVKGLNNVGTIPVITGNLVTTNGLLNIIGTVLKP